PETQAESWTDGGAELVDDQEMPQITPQDARSPLDMPRVAPPLLPVPVPQRSAGTGILVGRRGVTLETAEDLSTLSVKISKSRLAPKGMEHPESIFAAIEMGLELGLPPMSALQNIAVINGRPGIFGDAALALVRSSNLLADFEEKWGRWCNECRQPGEVVCG